MNARSLTSLFLPVLSATGALMLVLNTAWHDPQIFLQHDSDTVWHLAAGDWIRLHHQIPRHDPWSFTAGSTPWHNLSWLFDVALSALYSWGGTQLLFLIVLLIGAFVLASPLAVTTPLRTNAWAVAAAMLLTSPGLLLGLTWRPQLSTLLFTSILLILLIRVRHQKSASDKTYFILAILTVLWANCHGGALILPILIGCFGIESLFTNETAPFRDWLRLGILSALCLQINPYGLELIPGMFHTINSPLNVLLHEWGHFSLRLHWLLLPHILLFAALAISCRKPDALLLASLFWFVAGLVSIRHYYLFSLVSLFWISGQLHSISTISLLKHRPLIPRSLALGVVLALSGFILVSARHWPDQFNESDDPKTEVAFLKERFPRTPVFNFYNYGGYLIWESNGTIPVFVDARAETAYPMSIIAILKELSQNPASAPRIADQYHVNVALFPKESLIASEFLKSGKWEASFTGPIAVVLHRKGSS